MSFSRGRESRGVLQLYIDYHFYTLIITFAGMTIKKVSGSEKRESRKKGKDKNKCPTIKKRSVTYSGSASVSPGSDQRGAYTTERL